MQFKFVLTVNMYATLCNGALYMQQLGLWATAGLKKKIIKTRYNNKHSHNKSFVSGTRVAGFCLATLPGSIKLTRLCKNDHWAWARFYYAPSMQLSGQPPTPTHQRVHYAVNVRFRYFLGYWVVRLLALTNRHYYISKCVCVSVSLTACCSNMLLL